MADGAYNGLTIGGGDVSIVARVGLRGTAKRRDTSEPSPMGGTVLGPDDRNSRTITLTLGLRAFDAAAYQILSRQVRDAFTPGIVAPYTFDQDTAYVLATVEDVEVPEDFVFPVEDRFSEATVVLDCPDPLIYSADVTGNLTQASPLVVANTGTADAPFSVSIPGPCTDPRVRRNDDPTGLVYRFIGTTVGGGETLEVDFRERTARIGSVDHWPPTDDATNPSIPWGIPPGGETLLLGTGTGTPTAVVTSRSAWAS